MFSLVNFENDEWHIVKSKNAKKRHQSAKFRGCWYATKSQIESDNISFLEKTRKKHTNSQKKMSQNIGCPSPTKSSINNCVSYPVLNFSLGQLQKSHTDKCISHPLPIAPNSQLKAKYVSHPLTISAHSQSKDKCASQSVQDKRVSQPLPTSLLSHSEKCYIDKCLSEPLPINPLSQSQDKCVSQPVPNSPTCQSQDKCFSHPVPISPFRRSKDTCVSHPVPISPPSQSQDKCVSHPTTISPPSQSQGKCFSHPVPRSPLSHSRENSIDKYVSFIHSIENCTDNCVSHPVPTYPLSHSQDNFTEKCVSNDRSNSNEWIEKFISSIDSESMLESSHLDLSAANIIWPQIISNSSNLDQPNKLLQNSSDNSYPSTAIVDNNLPAPTGKCLTDSGIICPLNDFINPPIDASSVQILSSTTIEYTESDDISLLSSSLIAPKNNLTDFSQPKSAKITSFFSNKTQIPRNNYSLSSMSKISATNNSCSEYFPSSVIDSDSSKISRTRNTEKSLDEHEKTIEFVENPLRLHDIEVQHKCQKSKKHFCMFCKTLQTKICRHFLLKHRKEEKVIEFSSLPLKSKQRLKIIDDLRKQGNFIHNTCEDINTGVLLVSRQLGAKSKKNPDDYACCDNCKGFFSKSTIRTHIKRCKTSPRKNSRHNISNGRKLTQYIHRSANYTVRTKIFPILRNDDVTKTIRYDDLIIKYANKLTEKYDLTHQHDMIRARLRLLGRFVIELQKLDGTIYFLKDIYKPRLFDNCIKALRLVANWDESLMWFKTPAVAQSLTSLVKKCGATQRIEYIKTGSEALLKELENFLLLWEEEIPVLINKKACDDQFSQKRKKKFIMPSTKDIKKLYHYLESKILNAVNALEINFDINVWDELIKAALIFIQIFNRRRAGEIERLTVKCFSNRDKIDEHTAKTLLSEFGVETIECAKQFDRLSIRGKRGRTVGLLLSPLCVKAIEFILKFRKDANIPDSNEFVFCRQTLSKFSKPYYRACPLLKRFSTECGAQIPESLRGTHLRKHIATHASLLNIEDAAVDQLANFMGHNKDIHKNIYRVPVPVAEITRVSQLLISALGESSDSEESSSYNEESGDNEDIIGEVSINKQSGSKKRRSTSPFGKTKRCKWSQEEKDAIFTIFGKLEMLNKLPSAKECLLAVQSNDALKNRTPQQLKSWIDNQRRYKKK